MVRFESIFKSAVKAFQKQTILAGNSNFSIFPQAPHALTDLSHKLWGYPGMLPNSPTC